MVTQPNSKDFTLNKHILVIGVDPEIKNNLQTMLKGQAYELTFKDNLTEAIDTIQSSAYNHFSAYLLDESMLDSADLNRFLALKQHPHYNLTPIILQIHSNLSENIQKGLDFGMFFYLIQPYNSSLLKAVLSASSQCLMNHHEIKRRLTHFDKAHPLLQQAVFHIQSLTDAQAISSILGYITPDQKRASIGLFELMLNAIEHGNLDIGYAAKTKLIKEGSIESEIAHRLTQKQYQDKYAIVTFKRNEKNIEISIEDSGKGFDYQKYLDFSQERAMDNHGRGILIANRFSFDSMRYLNNGSKVVCQINL